MNPLTATRHPITGQVLVMPTDDLAPYLKFTQAFHAEHRPAGPTETHLVQTLADGAWRMNQLRAIQANLLAIGFDHHTGRLGAEHPQAHAALAVASGTADHIRQLAELSKHEARLDRQFRQTLALLRELQAERKAQSQAAPAPKLKSNGFVLSFPLPGPQAHAVGQAVLPVTTLAPTPPERYSNQ